jgi:hypothetical protein
MQLDVPHTHAVFAGDAVNPKRKIGHSAFLPIAIIVAPSTCTKRSLQVHAQHNVILPTIGHRDGALALALDTDQA